jgi:metal-responsive CopG/Arc/MetJ family transcriptional regulator
MAKKSPQIKVAVREKMVRKNRITILLNDKEMEAVNRYVKRYRVQNKSRFVRETLIRAILKQFDEDAPTLFD